MKRQNLRTVSLIVVTLTYLLIGAAIFGWLESDFEHQQREHLDLIELIVKRKYNISEDDFTVLTTTVIKSVPHRAGIQWRFSGAFYFATTVVTTIGYGHSTPATIWGRSFCMIYALIGIPLGLVMFQSIGERLNTFVAWGLKHIKRCYKAKNPEVTQTNLVMVVLVLSTILMTSMAAVFAKYERWDYFDALYYCFITLTTIGFGDYVALQKESALQSKPEYVALSLIFILFGLSVVSSAVNLLVLKFLTLNTEDERRDEQLRFTANQNPIQLEGDVITSAPPPPPPLPPPLLPPSSSSPLPVRHRHHHHQFGEAGEGVNEGQLAVVSHQHLGLQHRRYPSDHHGTGAFYLQHQFVGDTVSDDEEENEDEEEEEDEQYHHHHHQPPAYHSHHKLSAATSFQSQHLNRVGVCSRRIQRPQQTLTLSSSTSTTSDDDFSCSCSRLSLDFSTNQWTSMGNLRRSILANSPVAPPSPACCLSTTIKPHHYHHHHHHHHRRHRQQQPLPSHYKGRTRQRRPNWELNEGWQTPNVGHLSGSEQSVRENAAKLKPSMSGHRQQLPSSRSMRALGAVSAHLSLPGSSGEQPTRVTTRLVCKCCCRHSECIERALANISSLPTKSSEQRSKEEDLEETSTQATTASEKPGHDRHEQAED